VAKRTKSGLKRKRQDLKRAVRNQAIRSKVKTHVKQAREAGQPADSVRAAIAALDAAARKGILHSNAAARKKSRLMRWAGSQTQASA
jgi:small subunit ribosomal protein S20